MAIVRKHPDEAVEAVKEAKEEHDELSGMHEAKDVQAGRSAKEALDAATEFEDEVELDDDLDSNEHIGYVIHFGKRSNEDGAWEELSIRVDWEHHHGTQEEG